MTARTGLSDLILQLRGLTNAGTADWTNGTATYWDGDHVQEVLDRHRFDFTFERLDPIPKYLSGGTVQYLEYRSTRRNLEATTGGTAIFIVEDTTGADIGTALYSVDYSRGVVTFAADTAGTVYYLTGRSYDLYGAAADMWRMKAAHAAEQFDFSTDNHSVSRSQKIKHCLDMATMYEGKAGLNGENVVTMYRSDTYPA